MANATQTPKAEDASQAKGAVSVTPADSNLANGPCRALYIGATGDLAVTMVDGTGPVVFKNVPVGIMPISVSQVRSTDTTATEIIALY